MIPTSLSKKLLLTVFCLLMPLVASAGILDAISDEVNKVFEEASPAVVRIGTPQAVQPYGTGFGTGFFIDAGGRILTSITVVGASDTAYVEFKNKRYDAVVLCRDARSGIALLQIEASQTPFLKFANSNNLKLASTLISMGYPFNMPLAPNFGSVEGFDVQYQSKFFATTHIRTKISVSPGQIGGPLLNSKGEVVGMMVVTVEDGKSVYALPSNSAKKVLDDMFKYGQARHGWTGVGVIEKRVPESVEGDVYVSQLYRDTPASLSGLKVGDQVLKIGEHDIKKPSDVLDSAFYSKVGEKLPVLVKRDGKLMTFSIDVKERPSSSRMVEAVNPQAPSGAPVPANQLIKPAANNGAIQVDQKR